MLLASFSPGRTRYLEYCQSGGDPGSDGKQGPRRPSGRVQRAGLWRCGQGQPKSIVNLGLLPVAQSGVVLCPLLSKLVNLLYTFSLQIGCKIYLRS